MQPLSIILGGVVFVYTIFYIASKLKYIFRYKKAVNNNEICLLRGEISSLLNVEKKAYQGELISLSYPVFKYTGEDGEKCLQGVVRYSNAKIGDKVEIAYCERTEEAWIVKDIPILKRNLMMNVGIMFLVLLLLLLTEILL